MEGAEIEDRYQEFVRYIEDRPKDMSPIRRLAQMPNPPDEATAWLIRWVRETREE